MLFYYVRIEQHFCLFFFVHYKQTMMKHITIFFIFIFHCMLCAAKPICNITHYDENNGMAQWHVTQILQDKKGMMWFSTWNGLNRYDGYNFECFKSRVGDGCDMSTNRIRAIILRKDGNILCLVDESGFLFNTKTYHFQKVSESQENILKKQISYYHHGSKNYYRHKDLYGTIWHIYRNGTIYFIGSNDKLQPYVSDIKMMDINGCFTDVQNNLWLRSKYGIYKLSFKRKPAVDFPQKKQSQIRCFLVDNKHRYWISSKEDATVRLFDSNNKLLGYLGRDGKIHSQYISFTSPIYSMMQDRKGAVWMGSKPGGLFKLKECFSGVFMISNYKNNKSDKWSLSCNDIYDIKQDNKDRIWIATMGGGINCIQNPNIKNLKFINYNNQFCNYPYRENNKVRTLIITDKDILMAATTKGLITADVRSENVRSLRFYLNVMEPVRISSLSDNATMNIFEDSRHRIFVCTESGGVNQVLSSNLLSDKIKFKHFDTDKGMPTDVTLSMVEYKGTIIIVGANQIINLNPDNGNCVAFDSHFWKETFRFSDAKPVILPDGRLILGHMNGAFTIYPNQLKRSKFIPPIALTGISVQNKKMNMAVNSLDTLILQSDERSVTIRFAALDYTETNETNYAFRLNGKDDEWNYINKTHSATFLDMQPGKYQLEIKSTNADGVWVDNNRRLIIIVTPTFWETGWAMLLFLFLGGSIISGVIYTIMYIRQIKAKQKETLDAYLAAINDSAKTEEKIAKGREILKMARIKADDDAFMKRVMIFAEQHLSDADINMNDMAMATATSRSVLNRRMKTILGISPAEFIREARIQKASNMLAESDTPISEIAFCCGFSDPKYFTRIFKNVTGHTPSDYRITIEQKKD